MINIKGLSKAKVLAALYNASKPLGLGILQYDPPKYVRERGRGTLRRTVLL